MNRLANDSATRLKEILRNKDIGAVVEVNISNFKIIGNRWAAIKYTYMYQMVSFYYCNQ